MGLIWIGGEGRDHPSQGIDEIIGIDGDEETQAWGGLVIRLF